MLGPFPRSTRLLTALGLAVLLVCGCTDAPAEDRSRAIAEPTTTSPGTVATTEVPAEKVVRTRISTGSVTGAITKKRRKRVVRTVAQVVDRWLEAAYVGGDYPRASFGRSWPGFTRGATRTARGDRTLMSNADIGDRIEGVRVKQRAIVVDVLAVRGTARAATARVRLAFKAEGVKRRIRVTGRLFLTQKDGRWRIFGYDVAKART